MNPEDIARRFERKSGYELIDYAPVALPLYRLTLDVVTMVYSEIPPIKEFVMRSMAIGLSQPEEIAGFLGLDEAIVHATMDQLKSDGYAIDIEADHEFEMTDRGREVLAKAREATPQDEMQVFLYDRLLGRPLRLTAEEFLTPAAIDHRVTIEIRPYPAEGPDVTDLALVEVAQVLKIQAGGASEYGRDLLRLKRIVRRLRLFRPAIALVFKKNKGKEIQIEFVIDDARHEALSHAFSERGGPKKMGFIRNIDESTTAAQLRGYLGPDVQKLLPGQVALDEKRLAVSICKMKLQTAISSSMRSGIEPEQVNESVEVRNAMLALETADRELTAFAARPTAVYELVEFLERALKSANSRLFISSRYIDESVVTPSFVKRVERILERGVHIRVSATEALASGNKAVVELERLSKRFAGLTLVSENRSDFFHLVCDDAFALIATRPFLGNLGKYRSFQHVSGYLLQRGDLVSAFAARLVSEGAPIRASGKAPGRARK